MSFEGGHFFFQELHLAKKGERFTSHFKDLYVTPFYKREWKVDLAAKKAELTCYLEKFSIPSLQKKGRIESLVIEEGRCNAYFPEGALDCRFSLEKEKGIIYTKDGIISFTKGKKEDPFLIVGRGDQCSWEELLPLFRWISPSVPEGKGKLFFQFSLNNSQEKELSFSATGKDIQLYHPWGEMEMGWGSFHIAFPLTSIQRLSDAEIHADFSQGKIGKVESLSGFFSARPRNGLKAKIKDGKGNFFCQLRAFEKEQSYEWGEITLHFPQSSRGIDLHIKEEKILSWKVDLQKEEIPLLKDLFSSLLQTHQIKDVDLSLLSGNGEYDFATGKWKAALAMQDGVFSSDQLSYRSLTLSNGKGEGTLEKLHLAKGNLSASEISFKKINLRDISSQFDCNEEKIAGKLHGSLPGISFTGELGGKLESIRSDLTIFGNSWAIQNFLGKESSWDGTFSSSASLNIIPEKRSFSINGECKEGDGSITFYYENLFSHPFSEGKATCDFEKINLYYLNEFLPVTCEQGTLSGRLCLSDTNWTIHAEGKNPTLSKDFFSIRGKLEKNWFITALYEGKKENWYADIFIPQAVLSASKKVSLDVEGVTFTWEKDRWLYRAKELKQEALSFYLEGKMIPQEEILTAAFHSVDGEISPLLTLFSDKKIHPFRLKTKGEGMLILHKGEIADFSYAGEISEGESSFWGGKIEEVEGFVDVNLAEKRFLLLSASGNWRQKDEHFHCTIPLIDFSEEKGEAEIICSKGYYDIARLLFTAEKNEKGWQCVVDPKRSYLLQDPITKGEICLGSDGSFQSFSLEGSNDLSLLKETLPSFFPPTLVKERIKGALHFKMDENSLHLSADNLEIANYCLGKVSLLADRIDEGFYITGSDEKEHYIDLTMAKGEKGWDCNSGKMGQKGVWDSRFTLHIKEDASLFGEISSFRFPYHQHFNATATGKGMYALSMEDKRVTLDLDIDPVEGKRGSLLVKNRAPLHLHFDTDRGCQVSGIEISVEHPNHDLSNFHIKGESLLFDYDKKILTGKKVEAILPPTLLRYLSAEENLSTGELESYVDKWIASPYIELEGEISYSPDELSFVFSKCYLPGKDPLCKITHLEGKKTVDSLEAKGSLIYEGEDFYFHSIMKIEEMWHGDLFLADSEKQENPLHIEWAYSQGKWEAERITGSLLGISADLVESSFEKGVFLGSIWIDFSRSHLLLPEDVSLAASYLQLGKGFECKGKWDCRDAFSFRGLFTGKNCSIMGYTFKTLLSQVDISKEELSWFDFKLSDSCGIVKSDYIHVSQKEGGWYLSIPIITMHEFRPSLLQKEGEVKGVLDPFLIRELQLHKFQGYIGQEESFRGSGNFHFINSFKRGQTLLDIPSEFLGRIFGLDLELLIPVRGEVQYEIREGKVAFLDLFDAFSENQRSEFFFLKEHPPTMDLQGNLSIFIGMKHYVLFTFTENFIISVGGKILDPSFSLKRKKAFSL